MEPHHNSDSKFATPGEVDPSSTSYSRVSNPLVQSVILSAILRILSLIDFLIVFWICCICFAVRFG